MKDSKKESNNQDIEADEPMCLDWEALINMLEKDSSGIPSDPHRVHIEFGEKGTKPTTISLSKDLKKYAKAKPYGWLSEFVEKKVREALNNEPEYQKVIDKLKDEYNSPNGG